MKNRDVLKGRHRRQLERLYRRLATRTAPPRCRCGTPIGVAHKVTRPCPYRRCLHVYCEGCGRSMGTRILGDGCPCLRVEAHGRYAELPKPPVKTKTRARS